MKPNEMQNALATKEKPQGIESMIDASVRELKQALPAHMSAERLARIALTCVRMNPTLSECTPLSFMGALFTSAQVGIEPVADQAYILPFNNSRKVGGEWKTLKEAQFILGYRGLASLFFRHEKTIALSWGVVKENDEFDYQKGTDSFLHHKPAKTNRGETVGYWVVAEIAGGGKPFEYMSVEECMEHGKKHSKSAQNGNFGPKSPWTTNPDSMCLKTVLKQLMKLLPCSVELRRAVAADETSREFKHDIGDALDIPDNTNWSDDFDALDSANTKPEGGK